MTSGDDLLDLLFALDSEVPPDRRREVLDDAGALAHGADERARACLDALLWPRLAGILRDFDVAALPAHDSTAPVRWTSVVARALEVELDGVLDEDRDGFVIETRGRRARVVGFDEGVDRVEVGSRDLDVLIGVRLARRDGRLQLDRLGEAIPKRSRPAMAIASGDFDPAGSLAIAARRTHGAGRARALEELVALTREVPAVRAARLAQLPADARAALLAAAADELALQRTWIARTLDELEPQARWLDRPAILTDDPVAADDLANRALSLLAAREAVACTLQAVAELGGSPGESFDALDVKMRACVRAWSALDARRAQAAAELDAGSDRWWFAMPSEAAEQDDDAELDVAALAPALDWLRARVNGAGTVVLDRVEARALLASDAGRALAAQLGDRIDVEAAFPTAAEVKDQLADRPRVAGTRAVGSLEWWLESVAGELGPPVAATVWSACRDDRLHAANIQIEGKVGGEDARGIIDGTDRLVPDEPVPFRLVSGPTAAPGAAVTLYLGTVVLATGTLEGAIAVLDLLPDVATMLPTEGASIAPIYRALHFEVG